MTGRRLNPDLPAPADLFTHIERPDPMDTALRPVTELLPTNVEHKPGNDWTITITGSITDEQAAGITFRANPAQVTMGAFVEVVDHDGTRIGHVSTASYHERIAGPAYVTVTIELR